MHAATWTYFKCILQSGRYEQLQKATQGSTHLDTIPGRAGLEGMKQPRGGWECTWKGEEHKGKQGEIWGAWCVLVVMGHSAMRLLNSRGR